LIAGIILAAGESSRMGRDKALLPYHGKTFLEHILSTLREAGVRRSVVVLGHHADEIQRALGLREVEVAVNRDYQRGQTSSLQAGLEALGQENIEGALLCLVDHPAVSAETFRALATAFAASRAPAVIPTYEGRRGHPVLISRELFGELARLDPGQGANGVIRKYRERTQLIEVKDPGVVADVDEPETFERLA
jgi:molybdenum cofactor cytidylyltransferase